MKNNLMSALVFIVLGTALFIVSTFTPNSSIEKWSSFAFGILFPLYLFSINRLSKKLKPLLQRIKK
jgi:hypothetical protein